jgi:hypothetical protein
MAPTDDVERPRASSAAERQKSIVSMTEFEGMDEYTALQKYILFYRDNKTNPHAEKTQKKKAWWQFWKSGSPTAAGPVSDPGAVPDDCTYFPITFLTQLHAAHRLASAITSRGHLRRDLTFVELYLHFRWLAQRWPELKLSPASDAMAAGAVEPVMQASSTKPPVLLHAR